MYYCHVMYLPLMIWLPQFLYQYHVMYGNVIFAKVIVQNTAFSSWQKNGDNAFDCLLHDLLIAKLAAYGFDYHSLQMLRSYLSNRKQGKKNNYANSKYCNILFGVPQSFILGPLLFNIYICDIILGEWNNSKIRATRKIFANITRGNVP